MEKILFIAFMIVMNTAWAGGVLVGNGGNVVRCSGSGSWRSLDYILSNGMYGKNIELAKTRTLQESFDRIEELLAEKIPQKVASFREFREQIFNKDTSKQYVWKKSLQLDSVNRERVYMPLSCRNGLGLTIIQPVIVRTMKNQKVFFQYDEELYDELESQQLSFLLVHEWLWNFTNDSQTNRNLNYFFHTELFESMSAEKIAIFIKKMNGADFNF